jgi:hypothetical protein
MRKLTLCACMLWFAGMMYSCNRNQPTDVMSATTPNECYTSVVSRDSATLRINRMNNKVRGTLHLNFAKKADMYGEIAGSFRGDTLFADYTYKLGSDKETFRNPAAFLLKEGKLYQGYGEIVTIVGQTTFKKEVPIIFDRGFVFEPVKCN